LALRHDETGINGIRTSFSISVRLSGKGNSCAV
jgi:hypothetical protein